MVVEGRVSAHFGLSDKSATLSVCWPLRRVVDHHHPPLSVFVVNQTPPHPSFTSGGGVVVGSSGGAGARQAPLTSLSHPHRGSN